MSRELLKRILACRNIGYPLPTGVVAEIEAELTKTDPKPTGYTGVGLDLISLEEFEKLQTGMKLLYDTPLYEHPPSQHKLVYLSDDEIEEECPSIGISAFYDGVRFAERKHGIGDL